MSSADSHPTDELTLPTDAAAAATPAPRWPRRRWLQFRLRTLMGGTLLVGAFLGWWFHPFVVETRHGDGGVRTRFELRRDWRGRRVSHGEQAWYLRDGTKFTKTDYGTPLGRDEFGSLLMPELDFNSPAIFWFYQDSDLSLVVHGGGQTPGARPGAFRVRLFPFGRELIDEVQIAEEANE